MPEDRQQAAFDELCFYTLAHSDPAFIHQHAVDAFAVQQADQQTKPIKVTFGLIGLCLYLEQGCSGREVQRAHMRLARRRKQWPAFELPQERGAIRVKDVLAAAPGAARDEALERWCREVWQACAPIQPQVRELIRQELA